jgi:hypothetical protein
MSRFMSPTSVGAVAVLIDRPSDGVDIHDIEPADNIPRHSRLTSPLTIATTPPAATS